jgi:hypothetical protein
VQHQAILHVMHACIQTLIAKPETAGKGVLLSFD